MDPEYEGINLAEYEGINHEDFDVVRSTQFNDNYTRGVSHNSKWVLVWIRVIVGREPIFGAFSVQCETP